MTSFTLKLVTPQGIALETQVEEAFLPADDGVIGFLSHHVPTIGRLKEGALTYTQKRGDKGTKHHIKDGFYHFTKENECVAVLNSPVEKEEDA